jgi:ribonuclease PH
VAKQYKINGKPVRQMIAAVSVGICQGMPVLDLDYQEDSSADADMNIVMTEFGEYIEIQGTAENRSFRKDELDRLLDIASDGICEIIALQKKVLEA